MSYQSPEKPFSDKVKEERTSIYHSPVRLLIILIFTIYISETIVMFILSLMPPLSVKVEAFVDSTLLVILISPLLYLVVIRPIILLVNQRKKTLEELQKYTDKLEQSNRELQDFAHIASHDLQEPLRKVTAFGDRLKTKYGDTLGEQGLDYLERMQSAASRMQSLINGLLSFSRVMTKGKPFEPVDLSVIVGEVLSDLEIRVETTKAQVHVRDLTTIDADPLQMRQLMQNLIGNALKFNKQDEPPVVKLSGKLVHGNGTNGNGSSSHAEFCQIIVEDNGIGFDEKYADRIFGVFQRLHGRTEYEGTGIGLSVCKKIVERHGGNISAKSKPDQGAAFIITLPVKQHKE